MGIVSGGFNGGTITGALAVSPVPNTLNDLETITAPTGYANNSGTGNMLRLTDGTTNVLIVDAYGELTVKSPTGQDPPLFALKSTDNPLADVRIKPNLLSVTDNTGANWLSGSPSQMLFSSTTMGFFGHGSNTQPLAIANAAGGVVIDAEARTALNALLAAARTLGLIAT